MLARVFEERGLVTTALALIRLHAEKVKPPRALFVPFPLGFPLGKPNDPELQHGVIEGALGLLSHEKGPVLEDFQYDEPSEILLQASVVEAVESERSAADEVTALRPFYERWVEEHGGATAVGLSGIPQRRFRGVVRLLEEYARGESTDMEERPRDVALAQFIRYCADDIKAFFFEARMQQRPEANEPDLHRWFWGETAMGRLLVKVGDRMKASDDPAVKYHASGIYR
ncbi:MAG: hypothetical protein FJ320_09695 [SAR202 cluster bacterium]|nr:hypothetical protein [SAR202 cluster bacterium]